MNHEPTRWSGTARPVSLPIESSHGPAVTPPQQLHLVSAGYPARIRRAFVAGGVALALALAGSLAASLASSGAEPAAGQDTAVTSVSVDG